MAESLVDGTGFADFLRVAKQFYSSEKETLLTERKLQSNVNVKVQRRNSRNKIDVGRPTLEKVTE